MKLAIFLTHFRKNYSSCETNEAAKVCCVIFHNYYGKIFWSLLCFKILYRKINSFWDTLYYQHIALAVDVDTLMIQPNCARRCRWCPSGWKCHPRETYWWKSNKRASTLGLAIANSIPFCVYTAWRINQPKQIRVLNFIIFLFG